MQPMADALRVVSFISAYPPWTPARATASLAYLSIACERFKLGRLMRLTGKQQATEWNARAISQQVNFGAKTTFGTE